MSSDERRRAVHRLAYELVAFLAALPILAPHHPHPDGVMASPAALPAAAAGDESPEELAVTYRVPVTSISATGASGPVLTDSVGLTDDLVVEKF